jgi:predicted HTH transcriptional regulator
MEELLNEEEGSTLDFKLEQYPFQKASDEEKSELLKDILAFSNAWRRADAYILIGVQEVKGGRSIVKGTTT